MKAKVPASEISIDQAQLLPNMPVQETTVVTYGSRALFSQAMSEKTGTEIPDISS